MQKLVCLGRLGAAEPRLPSNLTALLPWSQEYCNCRSCTTLDLKTSFALSTRENMWVLVNEEKREAEGCHYLQLYKTLMTAWSS